MVLLIPQIEKTGLHDRPAGNPCHLQINILRVEAEI
jgi:hypothetical protein